MNARSCSNLILLAGAAATIGFVGACSSTPVWATSDGSSPYSQPAGTPNFSHPNGAAAPVTSVHEVAAASQANAWPNPPSRIEPAPTTVSTAAPITSTPSMVFTTVPTTAPLAAYSSPAPTAIPQPVAQPTRTAPANNEGETTTNLNRITFAEEGADFDPSVSRDGSRLVFASTQHSTSSDIYIKRTDSRVVTQLTNDPGQDAMPVISPDGSKIAFASDRAGNWDVYVMPISGGKAVQVTSDMADEIHPSWSPDSKHLVFTRMGHASGRWEMWTAEVQNPSVASFIGYGLFPQWCPVTGTGEGGADRILYQCGRERGQHAFGIWTIDINAGTASNATEIASSSTNALINPTWSPDGKWIAYAEVPVAQGQTTPQVGTKPASATLWMMSIEGEGRVRLTSGPGIALGPTWGNNNRLYFVSDRTGAENIWSLDLAPAVRSAQAAIGISSPAVAVTPTTQPTEKDSVANVPENTSK